MERIGEEPWRSRDGRELVHLPSRELHCVELDGPGYHRPVSYPSCIRNSIDDRLALLRAVLLKGKVNEPPLARDIIGGEILSQSVAQRSGTVVVELFVE